MYGDWTHWSRIKDTNAAVQNEYLKSGPPSRCMPGEVQRTECTAPQKVRLMLGQKIWIYVAHAKIVKLFSSSYHTRVNFFHKFYSSSRSWLMLTTMCPSALRLFFDTIWWKVPPLYPAVRPILPDFQLPKQNFAGTRNIQIKDVGLRGDGTDGAPCSLPNKSNFISVFLGHSLVERSKELWVF